MLGLPMISMSMMLRSAGLLFPENLRIISLLNSTKLLVFPIFFFIFLLKKIRLYNVECWKKKRRTKNRYNIDNTEKKLHRFTTYKYKYRVSLRQINLITILTKTRKKRNRKKKKQVAHSMWKHFEGLKRIMLSILI